MKVYTIKEISKMAGVSAGTVDRVLHKRGKVSPEKEEKVKSILKKIDYRPNQVARSLKLNKQYQLVVLLPDYQLDEYWRPCFDGIEQLKGPLEEKGVFAKVLKYNPSSSSHFEKICQKSIELNPDGIMLGALFLNESQSFLNTLKNKGIPFNLINTPVEGADFESFVGQDLVQSGRTAAHLFDVFLPERKTILIVHIAEDFENAFHMQQKEKGFRTYYSQKSCVNISTINIKAEEGASINQQLLDKRTGEIHGIFVTTSKAHLIAEVGANIPIIGYDLLKENISYLNNGGIKFLIYQNPKLQAYQGLSMLSDYLLKGEHSPNKKYLPIEIISSENVSSYQV